MVRKVFLLVFTIFLFASCGRVEIKREIKYFSDQTHFYLIRYLNGRYGVEYRNQVVLRNCKNKIYREGYNGDFAFRTQINDGWHYYNLSGEFLFEIPNSEFNMIHGRRMGDHMENCYISSETTDGEQKVYTLAGKSIILAGYRDIKSIFVSLDDETYYLFGFECYNDNDERYLYDLNNQILIGNYEYLDVISHGACPIFEVRKDDKSYYYNYRGEKIISVDKYYDTYTKYNPRGFYYIVCQTNSYYDEYGPYDDRLWLSFNGEVIKESGSRYENYNVVSNTSKEVRTRKQEILALIKATPKLNRTHDKSLSTNTPSQNNKGQNANNYTAPVYTTPSPTYNINTETQDNSRWIRHYNDTYNRYAKLVESHLSSLLTLEYSNSGNGTSSYAISQTKTSIRDAQENMRRIRNEAQQKGINITISNLENISF